MDFTVDRPIEDILPLTVLIPPFHQLRHMWNPGFEESEEIMQLDHVSIMKETLYFGSQEVPMHRCTEKI